MQKPFNGDEIATFMSTSAKEPKCESPDRIILSYALYIVFLSVWPRLLHFFVSISFPCYSFWCNFVSGEKSYFLGRVAFPSPLELLYIRCTYFVTMVNFFFLEALYRKEDKMRTHPIFKNCFSTLSERFSTQILENYKNQRLKVVRVSSSPTLFDDAMPDCKDIMGDTAAKKLLHGPNLAFDYLPVFGTVFFTYATLHQHGRVDSLVTWLEADFDGLVLSHTKI